MHRARATARARGWRKQRPGEGLAQDHELLWFDRHLDLNDLGFLPRANLRQLRTDFDLTRREFPADSLSLFTRWSLETTLRQNDFGQRLPATLRLEREWRFRRPFGITARLVRRRRARRPDHLWPTARCSCRGAGWPVRTTATRAVRAAASRRTWRCARRAPAIASPGS